MNIALDATPLTITTGGVARYTLELSRALSQYFPDDQYWFFSDQPITHIPLNIHLANRPHTFLDRRWWLYGLNKELERQEIDLFHGTDFAVPYVAKRPAVMMLHDLSPWMDRAWHKGSNRVRQRAPRLLRAGLATMVITPSEAVRRAAINHFSLDPKRVVAIPLAASEHFRPVEAPAPSRPFFLFVGTLEPRKNIARLIEAWRASRNDHGADLVLAGRVREDFSAPDPEPGLRILGAVPESDLPSLYSSALAVVYPSLYEGFGLPVLEAMQCGAAVITSRDPAILEVTGGDAAVHIEASDTNALAEALRNARNLRHLRDRAIARAREFSWRCTAEKTREVYAEAQRIFSHA